MNPNGEKTKFIPAYQEYGFLTGKEFFSPANRGNMK
jgi:hypothetical protein